MIYDVIDDSSRGMTGEYGQLNVWNDTLNKYVLFMPLETLPSVVGSVNSIDHDVTTSRFIGKIQGKISLEDKECTFLWCRDNIARLSEYVGKNLKFLVSYKDGTGWKFEGKITFRPEDATSSEKVTGTFTITPSYSDSEPTLNVLDLMAPTCFVSNGDLPSDIVITKLSATGAYKISLQSNMANATFTATSTSSDITASVDTKVLTITANAASNGIVSITASKEDCGSWTNYILVDATKAVA